MKSSYIALLIGSALAQAAGDDCSTDPTVCGDAQTTSLWCADWEDSATGPVQTCESCAIGGEYMVADSLGEMVPYICPADSPQGQFAGASSGFGKGDSNMEESSMKLATVAFSAMLVGATTLF